MSPENNHALIVPGSDGEGESSHPFSPEVLKEVITDQAVRYCADNDLHWKNLQEYQKAARIIAQAFIDGYPTVKSTTDHSTWITRSIQKGLAERKTNLIQGKATVFKLEKDNGFDIPVYADYGFTEKQITVADDELQHPNNHPKLQALPLILSEYPKRATATKRISTGIAADILGLPLDSQTQSRLPLLDSSAVQAQILRGATLSVIGRFVEQEYPFYRKQRLFQDLSAIYVGDAVLQQLPRIMEDFNRFLEKNQLSVEQFALQLAHQYAPYYAEEVSEEAVGHIFAEYITQINTKIERWQRSPVAKTPNDPNYLDRFRQFFRLLPLNPVGGGVEYGFNPNQAAMFEQDGKPHLWKHAVTVDGFYIPSSQDVSTGLWIARHNTGKLEEGLFKRLENARTAWNRYTTIQEKYEPRITAVYAKLTHIQSALDSVPPQDDSNPVTEESLENEWRRSSHLQRDYQRAKQILSANERRHKQSQTTRLEPTNEDLRTFAETRLKLFNGKIANHQNEIVKYGLELQVPSIQLLQKTGVPAYPNVQSVTESDHRMWGAIVQIHSEALRRLRLSGGPWDFNVDEFYAAAERYREAAIRENDERLIRYLNKAIGDERVEKTQAFFSESLYAAYRTWASLTSEFTAVSKLQNQKQLYATYLHTGENREEIARLHKNYYTSEATRIMLLSQIPQEKLEQLTENLAERNALQRIVEFSLEMKKAGTAGRKITVSPATISQDLLDHYATHPTQDYLVTLADLFNNAELNPYLAVSGMSRILLTSYLHILRSRFRIIEAKLHYNALESDWETAHAQYIHHKKWLHYTEQYNKWETRRTQIQTEFDHSEAQLLLAMKQNGFAIPAEDAS